jgi:hypothetical protein
MSPEFHIKSAVPTADPSAPFGRNTAERRSGQQSEFDGTSGQSLDRLPGCGNVHWRSLRVATDDLLSASAPAQKTIFDCLQPARNFPHLTFHSLFVCSGAKKRQVALEPAAIFSDGAVLISPIGEMVGRLHVKTERLGPKNSGNGNAICSLEPQLARSPRAVLEELFELLEDYAPTWYTLEHHNRAVAALIRGDW